MKTFSKVWVGLGLLAIFFGIVLVVIAACNGVTSEDIPTFSKTEEYSNVKSLDFQIGYGKLTVEEGDGFRIEAEHLSDKNFKSYVENGTWVIKSNRGRRYQLFDADIDLDHVGNWNFDTTPEIKLTVPKGFVADQVDFDIGAGVIEADKLNAKNGKFSVGAGTITIDNLKLSDKSEYEIGAGQMNLNHLDAKDITVDCGVGHVVIEGNVTGYNNISCGLGAVTMNLTGDRNDYYYNIKDSLGNVEINNENYFNIDGKKIGNETADNKFVLDCGVGSITLDIN